MEPIPAHDGHVLSWGAAGEMRLLEFLDRQSRLLVITGAGCSTGSGIPDYRDRDGSWKRSPPMQIRQFLGSDGARRRYWARSMSGWSRIADARPNQAHLALAALERAGRVGTLITQNVDGLHQRAGSRRVVDLHGRLDRVECLECCGVMTRGEFQSCLEALNPGWRAAIEGSAPDGDADLGAVDYSGFRVPACTGCGGVMRPSIVFFGENVPGPRVEIAYRALDDADALLVVGSSLMVWSGLRFVRRAVTQGKAVAAINLGRTRADEELDFRISGNCGEVLAGVAERLGPGG